MSRGIATSASFAGNSVLTVRLEELAARLNEAWENGAASSRALIGVLQESVRCREAEVTRLHGVIGTLYDKIRELSDVSVKLRDIDASKEVRLRQLENEKSRDDRISNLLEKPVNHLLQGAIGGVSAGSGATDESTKRATRARLALGRLFQERPDLCAHAQAHLGVDWMNLVDFVAG